MKEICCTLLLLLVALVPGNCQDAPKRPVEVSAVLGWTGFADEALLHHFVAGASVRMYLTPRLSVAPELLYMRGPGFDRDLVVVPNVAFDFGVTRRVRPYVIGGAGLLRHRDGIRTSPAQTTFFGGNEWIFGGGLGVKVFLNDRLFVSPEFRIGWAPFLRSTVSLGYRL